MIEKKGPQSTNKIVKHVGNMAQDEKQFWIRYSTNKQWA